MLLSFAVCFNLFAADHPEPASEPLLINAHAHNDYEHEYPLWDALHHGFSSIEADVHLVDGIFYVAHETEDIKLDRTIRSLYLDPLQELIRNNNGSVYGDGSRLFLLVDMKTEGPDGWSALNLLLGEYGAMLTRRDGADLKEGAVTVIVSGNRDLEAMLDTENCPALYDGRFEDLSSKSNSPLIPLISAGWADEFEWKGEGEILAADLVKMKNVIEMAHAQGRKIRFWGTDVPDADGQEYIWDLLLETGVDFINTDKLRELSTYVCERR